VNNQKFQNYVRVAWLLFTVTINLIVRQ